MVAKALFFICASALFAQSTLGQCHSRMTAPVAPCHAGLALNGPAYVSLALDGAWPRLAASYGGGLSVSSSSCTAPTGLAVTSENVYEGPVAVGGDLPFLGTAAMEGVFPTAGASAISYGCGDGAVAITAESPSEAAITPAAISPAAVAATSTPWGYRGTPAHGCGCGCGSSHLY